MTVTEMKTVIRLRDGSALRPKNGRAAIMGILNCTPDSFSDGGQCNTPEKSVERALDMLSDGADIIDIGGESTRPGSDAVPPDEETRRVLPVIRDILRQAPDALISIDTRKPSVARAALDAGAALINDVSPLSDDPEMLSVALDYGVPFVLMHIQGEPKTMQVRPTYDDVMTDILRFLSVRINELVDKGVPRDRIITDPGIGFGKTVEHNLRLIANLDRFRQLGVATLLGHSRKRFIDDCLSVPMAERDSVTLAVSAFSVLSTGVDILRVHDVRSHARMLRMFERLRGSREPE
ncbi:MAG: dihydropteroate synthase [Planctomycetota bacterium]